MFSIAIICSIFSIINMFCKVSLVKIVSQARNENQNTGHVQRMIWRGDAHLKK
jgi:hypothetical protein